MFVLGVFVAGVYNFLVLIPQWGAMDVEIKAPFAEDIEIAKVLCFET